MADISINPPGAPCCGNCRHPVDRREIAKALHEASIRDPRWLAEFIERQNRITAIRNPSNI